ncbi:hypothetical protein PUNSTDRAFT_49261 [Punctularia strigosozonata HHB-11173 SS5]|uniref:uncharacterized protein n=1 Tax=Punctularia strigosozonata (strain HHB-11173) TaxID=741275 RepID=UPI0004416DCA|nr:uncharacterized protein PUNSTDRAFT_49261 [Punctularia strigosozonata HHB-11173 SS5]EIN14478.1 hypothetical protein PUNSTDRAFT_49261 [Punctularia strigosozonata HHB-11173 SS5]
MFNLIRRISGSVLPRPDRSWNDDPTSNAPATGRKRRLSTSERDEDAQFASKRSRGGPPTVVEEADAAREESPRPTLSETEDAKTEEEVKEVTTGVKHVEIAEAEPKSDEADEEGLASQAATGPSESQAAIAAAPEADVAKEDVKEKTPAVEQKATDDAPKLVEATGVQEETAPPPASAIAEPPAASKPTETPDPTSSTEATPHSDVPTAADATKDAPRSSDHASETDQHDKDSSTDEATLNG